MVIADDHEVFRAGTRQVLQQIPGVQIVGEAADGISAIMLVRKLQPDILVLDAAMPMARGIEVYAEARRWSPDTRTILLTGFTSPGFIADWMQSGVDGIMLKTCSSDEMRQGFETVLQGGKFVAQAVRDLLESAAPPAELTDREREVMALILSGHPNVEIADKLSISVKTVEKHRGSMMAKLGVHTVAELMVHALREGLLDELKQL